MWEFIVAADGSGSGSGGGSGSAGHFDEQWEKVAFDDGRYRRTQWRPEEIDNDKGTKNECASFLFFLF